MASIVYTFTIRDNSGSNGGLRMTGLTPTFVFLKKTSDGSAISQPTISEISNGQYKFSFDAETNGEAAAQIDAGASLTLPGDRYIDFLLARDSSRIQSGIDSNGKVQLDLSQAVPTSNTAQTTGDALNAARAQGFGKWILSGTTLTLYASDGSTVVRTFTLDSATSPTSRT